MTRRRWIADEVSENTAALVGPHAEHLSRVLRARVGQKFDITTGTTVRTGVVTAISDSRVEFELGEEQAAQAAPAITLALAIFKFDRMEWAIEKATELGVTRIIPIVAQRTESHLAAAAAKRSERWQRIARQASEQSRGSVVPEIAQPIKGKELLKCPIDLRIVLSELERDLMLKDAVPPQSQQIIVAIGPEGGWTEAELIQFQEAGWVSASVGETILRAETAAIAATAVILSELHS
ncbi:MAG TPA: RsmE family RNA methyltransferase [Terriglobales bacterium]|jgi:16S rRNA (uracil1498-N3)-methyltransferase|nr:RsmE family RNA methyltransferase [Terriglobales bacterium]